MSYRQHINTLTQEYNEAIRALQDSYNHERSQLGWYQSSSALRYQYSRQYDTLLHEYMAKRRQLSTSYRLTHPEWAKRRQWLGWLFFIGIMASVVCCGASLPADDTPAPAPNAALDGSAAEKYWNADNIPIPYLKDSTQYVSNPDHVLAQNTVDRMNATLKRLENELNIQSVVIVVNHIENDDPFRMAQDVGNKYGVGYQDMGLVIVCGYQDHSINISPGKKLEADLTDAECHRLEQEYVIPAMRREMPDSAMLYLTEAVYATMQKKELPQMSRLTSDADELDSAVATSIGLTFLFIIGWCVFYLRLNRKYEWLATLGAISLLSNPFYQSSAGGFGGGGFGSGGFGGGGGFSGGSFGGGSFGGGGATSRW